MIILIDIGNTNIKINIEYKGVTNSIVISSDKYKLKDEYESIFLNKFSNISKVIISSVVPVITNEIQGYFKKYHNIESLIVGKNLKSGIAIKSSDARQVGSDLVSVSVGALDYGKDLLVIDMGTAVKLIHISNKSIVGASIMPGLVMSKNALINNSTLLSDVNLYPNMSSVFGKDTSECINSGLLFGFASMIDGMVSRANDEFNTKFKVICTGEDFELIEKYVKSEHIYDKSLVFKGLKNIILKNQ